MTLIFVLKNKKFVIIPKSIRSKIIFKLRINII